MWKMNSFLFVSNRFFVTLLTEQSLDSCKPHVSEIMSNSEAMLGTDVHTALPCETLKNPRNRVSKTLLFDLHRNEYSPFSGFSRRHRCNDE